MSNGITNEEFIGIARELELYHAIFSKIWQIGKPVFTDKITTAAVSFDKNGNCINFEFNPDFWKTRTPYEKNFIIGHECLHIILNHGTRLFKLNRDWGNTAADVVINELLVSGFGFDRSKLEWVDKNGCWINTVFKDYKKPIDKDRSMEYYYNLIKEDIHNKIKEALEKGELVLVDSHDGLNGMDGDSIGEILNDILGNMNSFEQNSLSKSLETSNKDEMDKCSEQVGTLPGNLTKIVKLGYVKSKKKWETVIKKWANKFLRDSDKDVEQWSRINRRFATLKGDLFLPSEMEVEEKEEVKKKITVVFFQDTSGSCIHLAERFFKAAKTLPKKRFDIKLYCFDTKVYETTLASGRLYGFGGTSFNILERYVYNTIANGDLKQYPKAIFIVTDGAGDYINPAKPKNWYWFLSNNYTYYIPKECNVFNLKDFE